MQEKLNQLSAKLEADANLSEKLFRMQTPEEVQSLLKGEGLHFSLEEIRMLRDDIVKTLENDELLDEELDDVAGGSAQTVVKNVVNQGRREGKNVLRKIYRSGW
ncbi:hypothetical protein ASZ90_019990 [hydrocarbon metagenome]|uniref:Nif11 domain-containing protein n=1 Tax=hydrocarbon metagenome TaxID=938273 RepID=A0A0W8E1Y2_9ZZZZ